MSIVEDSADRVDSANGLVSLKDAGALPPTEEEDIIGDEENPKRDVEVMSEPPEIDTTRFDGPPLVPVCGVRCQPWVARLVFVLMVVMLVPVVALSTCLVLELVRRGDNLQKVESLMSDARNASMQMLDSVVKMATLPSV